MTRPDPRPRIRACTLCAERFARTHTRHAPNPVTWFGPGAQVLIASQAPGIRVHRAGRPFADASGDRLRGWLGVDKEEFYDTGKFAILPNAFCFPGYNASGSDLPPPRVCAETWQRQALDFIGPVRLKVLIGAYAHRLHADASGKVSDNVRNWRAFLPDTFLLPHPSWRNNAWLNRNPWFAEELVPTLRAAVRAALDDRTADAP